MSKLTTLSGGEPSHALNFLATLAIGLGLHFSFISVLSDWKTPQEDATREIKDLGLEGAILFDLADIVQAEGDVESNTQQSTSSSARPEQIESAETIDPAKAKENPLLDQSPTPNKDPDLEFEITAPENEGESDKEAEQVATEIQEEYFEQSSTASDSSVGAPPPRPESAERGDKTTAEKQGLTAEEKAEISDWQREIVLALNALKIYPEGGRKFRAEGTTIIAFTIARDGRVLSRRIDKSSGWPILDQEALKVIDRASPLPAIPGFMSQDQVQLRIPISYAVK